MRGRRFGTLDVNKAGIERLYNLSQYLGLYEIKPDVYLSDGLFEDLRTESLFECQWRKHLGVYRINSPMPRCVTIDDAHKAVGATPCQICRSCHGLIRDSQQRCDERTMRKYVALLARALRALPKWPITISTMIPGPYGHRFTIRRDSQKVIKPVEDWARRNLPEVLIRALDEIGLRICPSPENSRNLERLRYAQGVSDAKPYGIPSPADSLEQLYFIQHFGVNMS